VTTAVDVKAIPLARLHPAEWNPRTIKDKRFQNLCASIQADPDFVWRRPVLAQLDGTIYAGNVRFRTDQHLGLETIPAIIEDMPTSWRGSGLYATTRSGANWSRMHLRNSWPGCETMAATLACSGLRTASSSGPSTVSDSQARSLTPMTSRPYLKSPLPQPGDLWQLGPHRILCGDARDPHEIVIA
jgi:hypothetical protein